jgi:hypothetical protein
MSNPLMLFTAMKKSKNLREKKSLLNHLFLSFRIATKVDASKKLALKL